MKNNIPTIDELTKQIFALRSEIGILVKALRSARRRIRHLEVDRNYWRGKCFVRKEQKNENV
jgi:hypothetical protein